MRLSSGYTPLPMPLHDLVVCGGQACQIRVQWVRHGCTSAKHRARRVAAHHELRQLAVKTCPRCPVRAARLSAVTLGVVNEPIRLAHFSDTHIGYEAYKALNSAGENQRAADFARAFVTACQEIIENDAPLVIHSGDVADRTHIPIRMMLLIRSWFAKVAGVRPDGSRRQLVVVAGNHEQPRNRKEACFLELFAGLPGVHIVTRGYQQIRFDGTGTSEGCDPALAGVVVHALPHDALKTVDYDEVRPVAGHINIFSTHGVAGGSELYVRSLGREFAVPGEVLARGWDYGALGHWHKQGPVSLVGGGFDRGQNGVVDPDGRERSGRIWYAGSTENSGFGDLADNGAERGWLDVVVTPGELPAVARRNIPIRPMVKLPRIDVSGLAPDEIRDRLIANIRDAELTGAVVAQPVEGAVREVWSLVDLGAIRAAAGMALHYDTVVKFTAAVNGSGDEHRGLGDVEAVLAERAEKLLADGERDGALAVARQLLARELARVDADPTGESETSAAATTAPGNPSAPTETLQGPEGLSSRTDEVLR